jgi:hypothetical protein
MEMLRLSGRFPVCDDKKECACFQFPDMVRVSRRQGDDAWRFWDSCSDAVRVGPNPSRAWSEERTARDERMLLHGAREEETLLGLVGVAASKKARAGSQVTPSEAVQMLGKRPHHSAISIKRSNKTTDNTRTAVFSDRNMTSAAGKRMATAPDETI